jgi:hypothetical protein
VFAESANVSGVNQATLASPGHCAAPGAVAIGKSVLLLVAGSAGHRAVSREVGIVEQPPAKLDLCGVMELSAGIGGAETPVGIVQRHTGSDAFDKSPADSNISRNPVDGHTSNRVGPTRGSWHARA